MKSFAIPMAHSLTMLANGPAADPRRSVKRSANIRYHGGRAAYAGAVCNILAFGANRRGITAAADGNPREAATTRFRATAIRKRRYRGTLGCHNRGGPNPPRCGMGHRS